MTKLEELKKKIQEANPKRQERLDIGLGVLENPILRLSDVLLAIGKADYKVIDKKLDQMGAPYHYWNKGMLLENFIFIMWNLKDDNIDNQSRECIEFLEKIFL